MKVFAVRSDCQFGVDRFSSDLSRAIGNTGGSAPDLIFRSGLFICGRESRESGLGGSRIRCVAVAEALVVAAISAYEADRAEARRRAFGGTAPVGWSVVANRMFALVHRGAVYPVQVEEVAPGCFRLALDGRTASVRLSSSSSSATSRPAAS